MLQTQHAFAQTANQLCQQTYSQTISNCAQGLAALPLNTRPGAQKACVQQAKAAKDTCVVGPTCPQILQATFDAAIVTCNTTWDVNLLCGANNIDPSCTYYANYQLGVCTQAATDALNYGLQNNCPVTK